MQEFVSIRGNVRGTTIPNLADSSRVGDVAVTPRGEVLVVQALPELAEIVRQGGSWQGRSTTGVAALTALPTTTAMLSLVNNEPAGGKIYVIDSFGTSENVADATQPDVTAIVAMLNKQGDAIATGTTETANIRSLSGCSVNTAATLLRSSTVVDNTWFFHNPAGAQLLTGAGSMQWKVNEILCRGLYMVRPGGTFSIHAIKAAAAAAVQHFPFIRWHEVQVTYRT